MQFSRRELLRAGATLAAATGAATFTLAESPRPAGVSAYAAIFPVLDEYVQAYMREMHAPGMTLVLADRSAVQRVVTYGLADLARRDAVRPDELFQIGSISKSFLALCLLQLRDAGKLDLHRPIVDYLPWFRVDSAFAPITAHHLLTHGSGLPDSGTVFLPCAQDRHLAAYAPGEHFHYNNMAFQLLGYLAWTLDGRELPDLLRGCILEPLGMQRTEPAITMEMRAKLVNSYCAFRNDRPALRSGALSEGPGIIETDGAGCIASSAADMGEYVRMLAAGGAGPHGRLVSAESFALFATPHLAASEFGPTASYGYGIAVDHLDGHRVLRHTGGMLSFMSAILVDLDDGVGAFASINAMQGYRPTAIIQFAAELMRAHRGGKPSGSVAKPTSPARIADSAAYAGTYRSEAGEALTISAEPGRLFLQHEGTRVVLEASGAPDRFLAVHPDLDRFELLFGRAGNPRGPITDVGWGGKWFIGTAHAGPTRFSYPAQWNSYVGHYRNEDPWLGSTRVVIRQGQLWLDGVIPLLAQGDRFRLGDEEQSPEWLRFLDVVNGRCMRLNLSGRDRWRVATP